MNRSLKMTACMLLGAASAVWAQVPAARDAAAVEDSHSARVTDYLGTELVTPEGEDLGKVKDMIIDARTGQVSYVLVDQGKGELRPIPFKTLAYYQGEEPKERYFILGMDRARYEKAPIVKPQDYSNFSYRNWSTSYVPEVNKYYSDVKAVRPAPFRRLGRNR